MKLRSLLATACVPVLLWPGDAFAKFYGLDRLLFLLVFWRCVAGLVIGVAVAMARRFSDFERRMLTISGGAAGLVAFFLILGDAWHALFELPQLFIFLLLIWLVTASVYWLTVSF